ncbi:helix-turn-helix domain-containing protein [Gordonia spumicola]|uniref:helix-turn-helix domain-containing protein n=1 Tax=Gordonia spumicola TaxID=589161 RepID=UPI00137A1E7D|nr:helix-turn-helix domain-containing protein [Gordonia spumicola]
MTHINSAYSGLVTRMRRRLVCIDMSKATLGNPQVEPSESLIAELRGALQAIPPAERPAPDRRADFTAREVADLAGLSMATIRREVRLGRLEAVRDGQRFAIPVFSYVRWRAARRRPVGGAQG